MIDFYKVLLAEKREAINEKITRYNQGLKVIEVTKGNVEELSKELEVTMVDVDKKVIETNIIVAQVEEASKSAQKDADGAAIVKADATIYVAKAMECQETCDRELGEALPALAKAQKAVENLDKNDIGELKGNPNPKQEYINVMEAIMYLLCIPGAPKVLKEWKTATKEMANPEAFKLRLMNLKPEDVPEDKKNTAKKILAGEGMEVDRVMKMSKAAGGLA